MVALAGLGLSLAAPDPARAYTISVSATIQASKCSSAHWQGKVHPVPNLGFYTSTKQNAGDVKACFYKLVLKDSDKKGDYYYADGSVSQTTTSKEPNEENAGNPWSFVISSNKSAIDGVYSATGNVSKPWNKASISPTFTVGFFSVSTTFTFANSETISRTSMSKAGAGWSAPGLQRTKQAEFGFSQKVAQGAVPKITWKVTMPFYAYTWTKTTCYYPRAGTFICYKPVERAGSKVLSWAA
jgi:hypothetical protein